MLQGLLKELIKYSKVPEKAPSLINKQALYQTVPVPEKVCWRLS